MRGHIGKSFIDTSTEVSIKATLWYIDAELDQWWSYVHFGLLGEISGHTRYHQRYYQRKFNSWLSRRNRIRNQFPELFI